MLDTPVLFLIFNRPLHTAKVFDEIRAARPNRLFVAADGPRTGIESDQENCRLVRTKVMSTIDWECEVKTLFRETNLGCGVAPAEAIAWFFENVEEGIILEDDCLPSPSFFEFCTTLLAYYRGDERIMHISGNNFQAERRRGDGSYYFSAYNHNWGWATWRRAWSKFDYTIADFDRDRISATLRQYGFKKRECNFWLAIFDRMVVEKPSDIWDYQWTYSIWKNSGLSILPNSNLVVNIGFGTDATHTKLVPDHFRPMKFGRPDTMAHPVRIRADAEADHFTFKTHFHVEDSLYRRLKNRLMLNSSIRSLYERTRN